MRGATVDPIVICTAATYLWAGSIGAFIGYLLYRRFK